MLGLKWKEREREKDGYLLYLSNGEPRIRHDETSWATLALSSHTVGDVVMLARMPDSAPMTP